MCELLSPLNDSFLMFLPADLWELDITSVALNWRSDETIWGVKTNKYKLFIRKRDSVVRT